MFIKILFSLAHCIAITSSSKWTQNNMTVEAKEGFTISCTITNIDFMSVVKIEHTMPGKNSTTFAMNGVLKSPYKEREKYLVDYRRDRFANSSTIYITFKETSSYDTGLYTCQNLQKSRDEHDHFNLTVLVPIKESYIALINLDDFDSIKELQGSNDLSFHPAFFSSLQPLENGIVVEVEEGHGLVCFATSDSPNFKIQATLEGEDITTVKFNVENLEHPYKSDDNLLENVQSNSEEMQKHYAWKAKVVKQVDRMFSNKNFTCTADAPLLPSIIASVTVQVEYVPVINCKQQKYVVEMEKKILVSCSVFANPMADVLWLDGENQINSSDIKITERVITPEEKEVELMINKVGSQHLRSYMIHSSNSHGNTTFTLTLAKKPGTRAQPVSPSLNERIVAAEEYSVAAESGLSSSRRFMIISISLYFASGLPQCIVWDRSE